MVSRPLRFSSAAAGRGRERGGPELGPPRGGLCAAARRPASGPLPAGTRGRATGDCVGRCRGSAMDSSLPPPHPQPCRVEDQGREADTETRVLEAVPGPHLWLLEFGTCLVENVF